MFSKVRSFVSSYPSSCKYFKANINYYLLVQTEFCPEATTEELNEACLSVEGELFSVWTDQKTYLDKVILKIQKIKEFGGCILLKNMSIPQGFHLLSRETVTTTHGAETKGMSKKQVSKEPGANSLKSRRYTACRTQSFLRAASQGEKINDSSTDLKLHIEKIEKEEPLASLVEIKEFLDPNDQILPEGTCLACKLALSHALFSGVPLYEEDARRHGVNLHDLKILRRLQMKLYGEMAWLNCNPL